MLSKYIEKIMLMFYKGCFGYINFLLAFRLAFATNFIFKICSSFRITTRVITLYNQNINKVRDYKNNGKKMDGNGK
jgi:hypothetical protein